MEAYTNVIKQCLTDTKHQIVILLDSIDDANNLTDIDWLPINLTDNIKIILTITSDCIDLKRIEESVEVNKGDWLLNQLRSKLNDENLLYLSPYSQEQWHDVLSMGGGGEFYAASGALFLPENWKLAIEKIPIQAKVIFFSILLLKLLNFLFVL